jgi:hypothetical protein
VVLTSPDHTAAADLEPPAPRRAPARASVLGQAATLALVALSWAAVDQVAGSSDLRRFAVGGWLALAVGTVIGSVTPAHRPFRRISAWVLVGALAFGVGFIAFFGGAVPSASMAFPAWIVTAAILGLDLRWVSRLRVWVFLSGVFVIPALVVSGSEQVLWAAAWLVGAFATLWILSSDVHRSLRRPTTETPVRATRRRPLDLFRILVVGITVGTAFGLVANSPSYSYQPLERLVRYLPFRPDLDLDLTLDLDIRDYEVDANGNEVRYRLTPEGQRFVLDPNTNEPFAVIERDGVDVFVRYDGTEAATISEGASVLTVPSANGSTSTTYQRDDDGWYLMAGEVRYGVELSGGTAVLTAPSGAELVAINGEVQVTGNPDFAPLAEATEGIVQVPSAAVLDGTVGEDTRVWRYGDTIEVDGWRQGRRSYDIDEPGLEVEVRRRGDDMEYTWTADRSKLRIYIPDLNQAGELEMDRSGNAFDYLEKLLAEEQAAETESGVDWAAWRERALRAGLVVVGLAALAGAGVLLIRRRRGPLPDRSWAEEIVARLERHGDTRTGPRHRAESVVAYLGRLADEVDRGNDRLRGVAEVLDDALYGDQPLDPQERAWVDDVVADLEAGGGAANREGDRTSAGEDDDRGTVDVDVDLTGSDQRDRPDRPDRPSELTPT